YPVGIIGPLHQPPSARAAPEHLHEPTSMRSCAARRRMQARDAGWFETVRPRGRHEDPIARRTESEERRNRKEAHMAMEQAHVTVEEAEHAVHSATARLAQAAHRAVDALSEYGARAEQRLRESGAAAGERSRELAERSRELIDQVQRYVEEHPMAAIGIAAAVGFAIGMMLGSSGRTGEPTGETEP